ncbi:hypothetical protein CDD80_7561 [Ophiocordyceps camponoti-rufipedis]|uniref:Uncharacterized protein n=1 Tax=Ophiocordyceps camponoti-rufipedis TaxID=2004952 RepID=A0A2C5YIP3_9HYPO|nr:hypothetical protein CDD80_7561 [Ophiocordyceps camponoti-rufipedis]
MCYNLSRFTCGHLNKTPTQCQTPPKRHSMLTSLLNPPRRCDKLTKPLITIDKPCPACSPEREDKGALRELKTKADNGVASFKAFLGAVGNSIESSSARSRSSEVINSTSRWAQEQITKTRRRASQDSDRSWVSPLARKIEAGELAPYETRTYPWI